LYHFEVCKNLSSWFLSNILLLFNVSQITFLYLLQNLSFYCMIFIPIFYSFVTIYGVRFPWKLFNYNFRPNGSGIISFYVIIYGFLLLKISVDVQSYYKIKFLLFNFCSLLNFYDVKTLVVYFFHNFLSFYFVNIDAFRFSWNLLNLDLRPNGSWIILFYIIIYRFLLLKKIQLICKVITSFKLLIFITIFFLFN
jgi:hypothetical protein